MVSSSVGPTPPSEALVLVGVASLLWSSRGRAPAGIRRCTQRSYGVVVSTLRSPPRSPAQPSWRASHRYLIRRYASPRAWLYPCALDWRAVGREPARASSAVVFSCYAVRCRAHGRTAIQQDIFSGQTPSSMHGRSIVRVTHGCSTCPVCWGSNTVGALHRDAAHTARFLRFKLESSASQHPFS